MKRISSLVLLLLILSPIYVSAQTINSMAGPALELFAFLWDSQIIDNNWAASKPILKAIPDDYKNIPGTIIKNGFKVESEKALLQIWNCYSLSGNWNRLYMFALQKEAKADINAPQMLFETLKSMFGKPTKLVDCGFLVDIGKSGLCTSSLQAEWIRGQRRIWYRTENLIFNRAPMPAYMTLQISDSQIEEDLSDLIYLRMQLITLYYPKDKKDLPFDQPPFTVIIDLNTKRVFSPGWILMGEIDVVDPVRLLIRWGGKDANSFMRIDRYSGTFEMEIPDNASATSTMLAKGTYEKLERSSAKIF